MFELFLLQMLTAAVLLRLVFVLRRQGRNRTHLAQMFGRPCAHLYINAAKWLLALAVKEPVWTSWIGARAPRRPLNVPEPAVKRSRSSLTASPANQSSSTQPPDGQTGRREREGGTPRTCGVLWKVKWKRHRRPFSPQGQEKTRTECLSSSSMFVRTFSVCNQLVKGHLHGSITV